MGKELSRISGGCENPVKATLLPIVFLSVVLAGFAGRGFGAETPLDFDTVRLAIIEGARQNEARLSSCVLHWTLQTKDDGFVPGRKMRAEGSYALYWDGERFATQYEWGMQEAEGSDEFGEMVRLGERMAFDGKELRRIPNIEDPHDIAISSKIKFKNDENWFEIVGWYGYNDYHPFLLEPDQLDHVIFEAFSVDKDNRQLIKVVATVEETNGRVLYYFDPDKNNCLVFKEQYTPAGQLEVECSYKYEQVPGGAWLAIEKDIKSIDPDTQKTRIYHHYELDVERCGFNDKSKIPEEVFHIPITRDMEISDYRGGVRINYDLDVTPLATETLEEMMTDFMNEESGSETQPPPRPPSENSEQAPKPTKAPAPVRLPVSDPDERPWKDMLVGTLTRFAGWPAIVVGVSMIVLAGYGWHRHRVRSSTGKR